MKSWLKYGSVYRLIISDEGYNGIYLGEKVSNDRLYTHNIMLVNKPYFSKQDNKEIKQDFSLIKFKECRFNEKGKLILRNMHYLKNIPHGERLYLEELCKSLQKLE